MKKIHWGTGIAMAITGFAGFMGFLTFQAIQTPSHLVREDYYEAGLQTDEVLAAALRGANLEALEIVHQDGLFHVLNLQPQHDLNTPVEFSAYFPSNPALDWSWTQVPKFDSCGHFHVKPPRKYVTNVSGLYHIKWSFGRKHYSQPAKINVNLHNFAPVPYTQ